MRSYFQRQQLQGAVPAVVCWRLHLILLIHWGLGRLLQELDDQLHWCGVCTLHISIKEGFVVRLRDHHKSATRYHSVVLDVGSAELTWVCLLQMFLQKAAVQQKLKPGGLKRRAGSTAAHSSYPVRCLRTHRPLLEVHKDVGFLSLTVAHSDGIHQCTVLIRRSTVMSFVESENLMSYWS